MLRHRLCTASSVLALVASLAFARTAAAADAVVVASEQNGFGRLVFTLDKSLKPTVRSANGIVVMAFPETVNVALEKIPGQAPAYLSMARRDPDGKTIRFATTKPMRVSILEAGERIYLDLLPESWTGLAPSLPPDVIEQLARRAQEAEELLRKANREREKRQPKDMMARVGNGPGFARLILDIGQTVPVEITRDGNALTMVFDAALRLSVAALKAQLPETVEDIRAETSAGLLKVMITVAPNAQMRAFREDDTVIVDFPKERAASASSEVILPSLPAAKAGIVATGKPTTTDPQLQTRAPATEVAVLPAKTALRSQIDLPTGTIRPEIIRSGEGIQLFIPFSGAVPAAAFMRQDTLWMVFDSAETVEAIAVPAEFKDRILRLDVDRVAGATIVRAQFAVKESLSFAPSSASSGWTASVGRAASQPTEPVTLHRGATSSGRTSLVAKLTGLGQVFWIDDPDTGDRLGIVTALGPAHALVKQQVFVELSALPTVHGLAISPKADDVVITAGLDEVMISRDTGLTLSLGIEERRRNDSGGNRELLLDVADWKTATKGDSRQRNNVLQREAAEGSKLDRNDKRLALAKARLAAGESSEARGILRVIEQDSATAASTKPVLLLRAIAAIHTNDHREASRLLNETAIALEGESFLWQGVMHAKNQRWVQALVGFRQSLDLIDQYPEDLQLMIRELVIRSAIETNDATFATQQIDLLEKTAGPPGHLQKISLLRGLVALLQDRSREAISNFDMAMASQDRAVEVEARLNRTLTVMNDASTDREMVIGELETITMIWRKSEIEVRALAQLGEMYAEDSRWRQAFAAARRVSEVMPEHPLARKLHDSMAARFEALFLEGQADKLPKVEAVGLFYDFRHLMPISRRGDEIVRRLADRLAELDLLDQASELLQHQVENRLGGVARARVGTRLAVLHLLNRKPAEAVQALRQSRSNELPEEVRRGRLLLEARALSELSRTDLAMEVIASQEGADVDRLRADILWRGKRWRDAGEAIEKVLDQRWQDSNELTDSERADVMSAGVSYVLAEDRVGLDRLRQKFLSKMAASQDGQSFELVSSNSRNRQQDFKDIARKLVARNTLTEFLDVYRKRYPEAAGGAQNSSAAQEAIDEMKARQQGAKPPAVSPG